ncbi:hypothetical protein R3X27_20085 [Tropicimonas sp. TH_r6]|uniref:hypothetical protein n=1 Tax=Tropicimonas sp. TH_r6 TaxID=3082085 RepID=UPI0029556C9B|nr:hypothetical protein [Tropicimonas sp. TH_r6]MDV7144987.1 hypothetical protein [Tropicimonas sp. TH_r6]
MPADQAFMDRLHRIEAGKAWVPEGVIVDRGKKRKRVDINAGQKRVTLLLSIGLIWGLVWVFAQAQPELYGQFIAGDFSAVTGVIESIPLDRLPLPESVTDA